MAPSNTATKQRNATQSSRPMGSVLVRKAEGAIGTLARIFEDGHRVALKKGAVILEIAPSRAVNGDLLRRFETNPDGINEVAAGPKTRKPWAESFYEVAVSLEMKAGEVSRIAGVFLKQRSFISGGFLISNCRAPDALANLARLFEGVTGVVVRTQNFKERSVLGLLLADARIGRGSLQVTEVPSDRGEDYRNFLAGSIWLEMTNLPEPSDLLASSVLLAMQVRSIRRNALVQRRQGYYTASAARHLFRSGLNQAQIAERFDMPGKKIVDWTAGGSGKEAPAQVPDSRPNRAPARPATQNQVSFAKSLISEFGFLSGILPDDWEKDTRSASAFLTRATAAVNPRRNDIAALRLEARARDLLNEGNPAGAAELLKLSAETLGSRLETLDLRIKAMARDLGDALGTSVDPASILS